MENPDAQKNVADFIRDDIHKKLVDIFDQAWNRLEMNNILIILFQFKQIYNDPSHKAWRPTGKPVQEQLASLRLQIMNNQCKALAKKIEDEQLPVLERLFTMVEEKRENLEQHLLNKENIMRLFEQRNNQMNTTMCQLVELHKKLNYRQMEKNG